MQYSFNALKLLRRSSNYIIPLVLSVSINYLWYRGLPIYGGDQLEILAKGINPFYLINPVLYAYTNYPYGFIPTVAGTSWTLLILLPFAFFGNLSEEIFSTVLSFIGSYYVLKIAENYHPSRLASFFSAFLYLTNWFIFVGNVEMPFIYWNIMETYFLLPVVTYYSLRFYQSKISFTKTYPIITVISSYLLFISGEIFPIVWLGLVLVFGYFFRHKILHFLLILLSFTIPQFYWIFSFASSIIPQYEPLKNQSIAIVNFFSSAPLIYSTSSYISSVIPYSENVIFLVILGFVSILSLIFTKGDLRFFSVLWLIILGFDSSIYTPWYGLVNYAVSHYAFFALFRTTLFATSPFAGLFFSLIVPSLIRGKYKTGIFLMLLLLFSILNLPVMSGSLANRVNPPPYFLELVNYLNSQKGEFTIAVFPTVLHGWYSTSWYYGDEIYVDYSIHPVIIGGTASGVYFYQYYFKLNYLLYFFNLSNQGYVTYIQNLFTLLNVKYIIIEGDAQSNITFINLLYLPIKPYLQNLELLSENYHMVSFVKQFGPLYLYKVNLNTSYAYYTNTSKIDVNAQNLSAVLKPAPIHFISPTEVLVPPSSSKYVLVTFAYSPYWVSNISTPTNSSNFNLYQVNGGGIVIHDALQGELVKDDVYALLSITFPIIISLILKELGTKLTKRKIFK